MTTMLAAALSYIAQGFPVFPCCWPMGSKCGCGKAHEGRDVGKAPLTPHGLKDATMMQLSVNDYWTRWPRANIGIAIPPGHFVLDMDIEHGGLESLEKLQNEVCELTKTRMTNTGTGGQHYWYLTDKPIRNTVKLAGYEGLDVRGVGGYVIEPPSLHRCGQRYTESFWNGPITAAPSALIELCLKRQPAVTNNPDNPIPEHTRNHTLASLAGSMRRKGFAEPAILAALMETNRLQCSPPLAEDEVRRIAQSIGRYQPEITQPKSGFRGGVTL